MYGIQPVIEVLPEIALGDFLLKILVGRSYHPDIHLNIFVAADPRELLFLKHPEHLSLCRQTHVAHLVQQQRASVSLFELALVLLDCGSEGTLLVPEQLALDELRRNSRAVHFDIRHRTPQALLMQAPGHQLLAGTVRACDEHPRVCRGDLLDHSAYMLKRF